MKRVKKIIAVMLSIITMFSFNVAEIAMTNIVKADTGFMITSPAAESLKAAGYIDIQWTDASALGEVSSYKIYVDGNLVTTTKDLSCEFYTTKVSYHTAYVEADYIDGKTATTSSVRFGVTKKGICVSTNMGRNLNPTKLNAGWYYNWGVTPYSYTGYNQLEYVPMVWGDKSASIINNKINNSISQGYKYILGFNEPDYTDQANISVEEAVSLWSNFMDKDIRVGSPASALWPSISTNWFQPFMKQIQEKEMDVDFITVHCYPANWNGGKSMADWFLKEVVDKTWEMYHKPIWITEFSTSGNGITNEGTASFLEYLMPGLDERAYVERYSFFSFNKAEFDGGLWWYSNGELSEAGQVYAKYGNPATDNNTEGATTVNTENPSTTPTQTVKKPAKVKFKSLKNIKKRKIKISIKKIKNVAGYQIRWSDSKKFRGYWQKITKKTQYTLKKLDKNTRYYIKVRAYVKSGNKKVYGKWSKIRNIKVKK